MAGESGHSATATGQAKRPAEDGFEFSLATAPATAGHRRMALIVIAATIGAYLAIIPFASIRLPRVDSFIPSLFSIIFVADLVTAVLLFAQFKATGLRPLLILACGYLFSSLIVVGHLLTYPGAFSPTGLLGAGTQSASWLNMLWRSGLSVSFAVYAVLKLRDQPLDAAQWAPRSAIPWGVAIVVAMVGALIFAVTAGHDLLPPLLSNGRITLVGRMGVLAVLIANLVALALLMRTRGRSILDVLLIVSAAALTAESAFIFLIVQQRWDFSFYALRLIALPVSKVVLIALLWELMRLYANLAISHRELRSERASRLLNAGTVIAAIAHEIRQPLAGINLLAYSGQKSLERAAPDIGSLKKLLGEIKDGASRANEVFDNFLRLVRSDRRELQLVDVNLLTLEAAGLLKKNLDDNSVTITTKLAPDLPAIQAHKGQIREVILNLIQNAIEAMAQVEGGQRLLAITTSRPGRDAVSISIQDTGPGIEPENLTSIFDPFVTTKESGRGLGLAICKMIVDQYGGELSATSGGGGGARFRITLPAAAKERAVPPTGKEGALPQEIR